MSEIEFLKYEEFKTDYQMGIATVRYGKVILRYKVVQKKDGSGYFPSAASYKVTDHGEDKFLKSFTVDSRADEEEIEQAIRSGVKIFMTQSCVAPKLTQNHYKDTEIPF